MPEDKKTETRRAADLLHVLAQPMAGSGGADSLAIYLNSGVPAQWRTVHALIRLFPPMAQLKAASLALEFIDDRLDFETAVMATIIPRRILFASPVWRDPTFQRLAPQC